jgi:hypothetical protein
VKIPPGRFFFASLFAFFVSCAGVAGLDSFERSVSPSGQFIIYGADDGLRGSVSALAEQTKTNLLSVLKQRDDWKMAIVVNLQPSAVNLPDLAASSLRFSRSESGLKLQLDLTLSHQMKLAGIERNLAQVILIEMIYRNHSDIASGDVYVGPPAWLVDGMLASAPNRNRHSLAGTLPALSHPPSITEFLNQRPETLDPSAREVYRVYSFVLVQTLIDSPAGRSRLSHYIDNLAFASNDPIANLRAAFPEMGKFEATWKAKVAELTKSLDQDLLSFSQSDEQLTEIVKSASRNAPDGSVSMEEFSHGRLTPAQQTALREFSRNLLLLSTRANPVLRPVIQEYQRITDQLVLGKNRGMAKRLAELQSLRARLSARMSDVDDYLNWFEAAKLETPSGIFDSSLQTADSASHKPRRNDPLSVYLDAMELEF